MFKNVGWWCLFFNKDYELQVAGSFGCSKKDFYDDILENYSPRFIVTINRMHLSRRERKMLREMNEILTTKGDKK